MNGEGPGTIVSFHAHPDDEALFTGGYLALAAAAGARVVLVFATAGERGLTDPGLAPGDSLAQIRTGEATRAAAALGCARVVFLGYADSGFDPSPVTGTGECRETSDARTDDTAATPFARAGVEEAAELLAAILDEERADVLTTYDVHGGYGHPDHVQVHRVGARAAELAVVTPTVMEATVDRASLCRAVGWLRRVRWLVPELDLPRFDNLFTARADITHRIDVRTQVDAKRRAMAAHVTQTTGQPGLRTLRFFLLLPRPLFRRVLGYEWFVETGPRSDQVGLNGAASNPVTASPASTQTTPVLK